MRNLRCSDNQRPIDRNRKMRGLIISLITMPINTSTCLSVYFLIIMCHLTESITLRNSISSTNLQTLDPFVNLSHYQVLLLISTPLRIFFPFSSKSLSRFMRVLVRIVCLFSSIAGLVSLISTRSLTCLVLLFVFFVSIRLILSLLYL